MIRSLAVGWSQYQKENETDETIMRFDLRLMRQKTGKKPSLLTRFFLHSVRIYFWLFFTSASLMARTFRGSPNRVMNPLAS